MLSTLSPASDTTRVTAPIRGKGNSAPTVLSDLDPSLPGARVPQGHQGTPRAHRHWHRLLLRWINILKQGF